MNQREFDGRALAIYLTARGVAFVVSEGLDSPIDWGLKKAQGPDKDTLYLERFRTLTESYHPDVVIIEDYRPKHRRALRIRRLYRGIDECAHAQKLETYQVSRLEILRCFSTHGARTKYEIALAISKVLPELAPRLPPKRRAWMSEDARMSIFDAAALLMTFYHQDNGLPMLRDR